MNSTYVQLKKNLEYLKLNQMDLHLDEVIDLITRHHYHLRKVSVN